MYNAIVLGGIVNKKDFFDGFGGFLIGCIVAFVIIIVRDFNKGIIGMKEIIIGLLIFILLLLPLAYLVNKYKEV